MDGTAEVNIDPELLGQGYSNAADFTLEQNGAHLQEDDAVDNEVAEEQDEDEDAIVSRKRTGDAALTDDQNEEGDDRAPADQPKKKKRRQTDGEIDVDVDVDVDADADADEEEGRRETEQERRRREMLERIDAAAKGPKKRSRKKADETDLDQVADDEVERMRVAMQTAAEEDQRANELKRPATAKLRMLKDAVETLQKTGYQQAILDNNLLEAVRMWLEPLPDKSLPSLNIQKAMFPLLDRMYIDSTSLKMSGLGKLVLFYTRCDRVDKGIARIADRLIEQWSRPILKRSSSYRDRQQARKEYQVDPMRAMQRAAVKSSQSASQANSQRARIPESVTGNAFKYAPVTTLSDRGEEARTTNQKINKFKRSMQAAKQR